MSDFACKHLLNSVQVICLPKKSLRVLVEYQTLDDIFRTTVTSRFDVLYLGNISQEVDDGGLVTVLLTAALYNNKL